MEADYSNPDASKSLPAIRQLLFEGKNREAQELMYSSFVPKKQETDGRYGTYQVLGDLDIDFTYNSSLSILNSPLNIIRTEGSARTFRIVHIMTDNPLTGISDIGIRLRKPENQ